MLIEHHLEFLSLKGGSTSSSQSTLVKMPYCWKSHVAAHIRFVIACVRLGIKVTLQSYTYTTFTNFSMKYLVMCIVYTDDGGIK